MEFTLQVGEFVKRPEENQQINRGMPPLLGGLGGKGTGCPTSRTVGLASRQEITRGVYLKHGAKSCPWILLKKKSRSISGIHQEVELRSAEKLAA